MNAVQAAVGLFQIFADNPGLGLKVCAENIQRIREPATF